MEFQEGAKVFSQSGQEIGSLDRVVIDPKSHEISDLIVRQGLLDVKHKVVPIGLVSESSPDGIRLREIPEGFDRLKDFEETTYVAVDEEELMRGRTVPELVVPSVIYYPPMMMAPGLPLPPLSDVPVGEGVRGAGDSPGMMERTETNIPPGTVAVKSGAKVFGRDDRRLGNVDRIFTSEDGRRATHFLITSGWLFKEKKMVPVEWIDHAHEDEVHLSVGASQVERVPDFHEK